MKTCLDCSAYLPIPLGEATEFGICLNEEAFEPFVEELLEGMMPDSAKGIVEWHKFAGDRPACGDFDEPEIIEIDDASSLGQELRRLAESGEAMSGDLEELLLWKMAESIDFGSYPVDGYVAQLESTRSEERDAGISSLGGLIACGNTAAFKALLDFLRSLPPPATIGEVHLKIDILRKLESWEDRSPLASILVKELGIVSSNNTTRQWIAAIFRFLEKCPLQEVDGPLRRLLADTNLTEGMRRRVKEILAR